MLRVSFKSWLDSWQEWGVIILLFLALVIAVGSIEQAQWITPQPSLTLILVLAVLTGWLLCQSRLPTIVIYPLAVVLGAAVTVWQASNLLPSPEITSRVGQLAMALQSWWQAVSAAKPGEGTIHFAVFLIFFTWIMGYISTWFILRRQNAWVAVFLGAITILINLGNLPEQYYTFFFFYALAALLLVGQTNLARQHYWFKKHDITYPNRGIIYFMASLLCLSILAVSTAWLTPEVRVERLETLITTKTLWLKNIEKHFNNLLASVPAKQPFLSSDDKRVLSFGDSSFNQGNQLQLIVVSEQPLYWRTRMYDSYNSSGWTSSNTTEHILGQGSHNTEAGEISKRNEVTYTVAPKIKTDILPTGGEFISSSIPVSVQTLAPLSFSIENGPTLESTPTSAQLTTVAVTRTQPVSNDIVTVSSLYTLKPDRRYTVTTSISSAALEDLSGAGDDYPYWVTDYYLQLPPTLPERVGRLSETVTEEAKTPYDKALAIKHYLAQFAYILEVKAPPQGVDGVDHFLFTQKSGNCVDFASAMAVMLRSVGVPSRFSSGYSPGEWDAATGISTLRAKNRHTWPEVYFPGYGWVGFEATPGADSELGAASVGGSGFGWWLGLEEMDVDEWWTLVRWLKGLERQELLEWLKSFGREQELDEWVEWLGQIEPPDENIGGGNTGVSGVGATSRNRLGITLFFATGTILLVYILWSSVLSRRRQRLVRSDYTSETYRKMCRLASLARLGPQPQQTPLEYCARLTSVFPIQAEAIDCIVQTYVERQFSRRKEADIWQRGRLQKSWKRIYPLFLKRLFHIRY